MLEVWKQVMSLDDYWRCPECDTLNGPSKVMCKWCGCAAPDVVVARSSLFVAPFPYLRATPIVESLRLNITPIAISILSSPYILNRIESSYIGNTVCACMCACAYPRRGLVSSFLRASGATRSKLLYRSSKKGIL